MIGVLMWIKNCVVMITQFGIIALVLGIVVLALAAWYFEPDEEDSGLHE